MAGQRLLIDLDADRRLLSAADEDLSHAVDLGDLLGQHGVGGVEHLRQRERLRGEGEDQDRRVGRVDLAVVGEAGQVGRQLGERGVDGGLHVARGAGDVAIEIELQGDGRRAQRVDRGHLGQAGDAAEAAFERGGHRGGHGVGAGAGQGARDLDGGKIDAGERRDRQAAVGDEPGQDHRRRQQRGGDGPPDEGRRDVHGVSGAGLLPAGAGRAGAPSGSGEGFLPRRKRAPSRSM